jgi:carboxylate-amine ligase
MTNSPVRTVGVEEEFLLVDDAAGTVSPLAAALLHEAEGVETPDGAPVAVAELKREQAEIGSVPCSSLAELRANLVARRQRVAAVAARIAVSVAAVGTSPVSAGPTTTADERYESMTNEFGLVARQQLTCGTHVHVSIGSRAEGIAVLDRIRVWLPILLALSSNSPFWEGEDSGYASYRSVAWGQWPTAGPVEPFVDEAGYDRAVAELLASGTILDDGMIYFDVRLSAHYPTVEIRVADACTDVDQAVLLAGLCRALVDTTSSAAAAHIAPIEARVSLLRVATWRAAKSGMTGDLVDVRTGRPVSAWSLVDDLVEEVRPALDANGDFEFVRSTLDRLRATGTGAQLQRAAYSENSDVQQVLMDVVRRTAARS